MHINAVDKYIVTKEMKKRKWQVCNIVKKFEIDKNIFTIYTVYSEDLITYKPGQIKSTDNEKLSAGYRFPSSVELNISVQVFISRSQVAYLNLLPLPVTAQPLYVYYPGGG